MEYSVDTSFIEDIRPAETARLTWDAINLEERVVCLKGFHSKTGGMVQIHSVLHQLLKEAWPPQKETSVCPPNWTECSMKWGIPDCICLNPAI